MLWVLSAWQDGFVLNIEKSWFSSVFFDGGLNEYWPVRVPRFNHFFSSLLSAPPRGSFTLPPHLIPHPSSHRHTLSCPGSSTSRPMPGTFLSSPTVPSSSSNPRRDFSRHDSPGFQRFSSSPNISSSSTPFKTGESSSYRPRGKDMARKKSSFFNFMNHRPKNSKRWPLTHRFLCI